MAGAISVGAAAPADAATRAEPEPRRSVPPICRHAMDTRDRYSMHRCRKAWSEMQERSRRRSGRDGGFDRRGDWDDREHRGRRRYPSLRHLEDLLRHRPTPNVPTTPPPSPVRPENNGPSRTPSPKATPTRSTEPTTRTRSPQPTTTIGQADDLDSRPPSLQPVLLLGILLPAVAAICYPFRRRLCAVAGVSPFSTAGAADPPQTRLGGGPTLDPFAAPAIGLTGSGAAATARILALTALDEHGDNSLVVIPRPDTISLFGLAEDELLDDDIPALFIPGNLDAALAYLETELAIRESTGVTQARRLLLVADPDGETDRIKALLDHHPGGVFVILLGPWTGDQAVIDGEGQVDAPSSVAAPLPGRLPAMSRTEARDRLLAALARQTHAPRPTSKRRSGHRRP